MCGRYSQTAGIEVLKARFGFACAEGTTLRPRYNLSPGQEAPVVIAEGRPGLALLLWGLIPAWARDPSVGSRMINARAETLAEKPSFKAPLERRRCLVLADGFYEWAKPPSGPGIPSRFTLKHGGAFAFAGLWDAWKDPQGKVRRTFTIITTQANELVRPVHERMPVILPHDAEPLWLAPTAAPARLLGLLAPYPASEMDRREASPLVNSPRNDGPEVLGA